MREEEANSNTTNARNIRSSMSRLSKARTCLSTPCVRSSLEADNSWVWRRNRRKRTPQLAQLLACLACLHEAGQQRMRDLFLQRPTWEAFKVFETEGAYHRDSARSPYCNLRAGVRYAGTSMSREEVPVLMDAGRCHQHGRSYKTRSKVKGRRFF